MAQAAHEQVSGSTTRRGPRRRHPIAQKLAIIRECLEPGASLAGVALAHRVNANMVRKWVVKYQQGGYGESPDGGTAMLPVVVKPQKVVRRSHAKVDTTTTVEIELRRGVLRVHGVNAAVLNALIAALAA
jgi:transposase